jgi:acetyl-CoA C-acetyltransferase
MDRHSFAVRRTGTLEACEIAAKRAYAHAGWQSTTKPTLAEVSASSAVGELLVLEALGIAKPGRGIDVLEGSDSMINESGGALPADVLMATGLVRLSEAARQLADAAETGKSKAGSAIAHAAGGVGMQTHCVFTLEI